MQSLNQYSTQSFDPSDIERHLRKARAMRSEAANQMVKSTLEHGSQMIRDFMSSDARTSKA